MTGSDGKRGGNVKNQLLLVLLGGVIVGCKAQIPEKGGERTVVPAKSPVAETVEPREERRKPQEPAVAPPPREF